MYFYRMHELFQQRAKEKAAFKKATEDRVQKVIKGSVACQRVTDYPKVYEYLHARFPKIDITDVPIYRASPEVFKKSRWSGVGGLFVPWMSLILVKDVSLGQKDAPAARGAFEKELTKFQLNATTEDVVVHECLHAISHRAGRSCSKYRHLEEEFVYTNCIDFYKQSGMTTQDIIEKNFLPFCMQDVMENRKDMLEVLKLLFDSGVPFVDYFGLSRSERRKFDNTHATYIVARVVEKAVEKGKYMVDCYNRYGQGVSLPTGNLTDKSLRFSSINMDCEI
jgi:hypothetical protein